MLKIQTVWALALAMFAFHSFAQGNTNDRLTLFVGTYTDGGNSKGIYIYSFNQEDGSFELLGNAPARNPSFLTLSPDGTRLYAVSECNDGQQGAYSFDVSEDKQQLSNPVFQSTVPLNSSGDELKRSGADPCYIFTDGKNVLTANYTGGDISLFPLDEEGRLKAETEHIEFEGQRPDKVAHIHCIVPTPDGRYILATDLGNDFIYHFTYNPSKTQEGGQLLDDMDVIYQVNKGQGPRHLTFSKDGRFAYLINELGGECTVLKYENGRMTEVQRIMADEGGGHGSADIHISPDGRFLYTSHRQKKDGLSIFSIDPQEGTLKKVGYQLTGIHPRNFNITPNGKYLLVACRNDNSIRIYRRNLGTGELIDTLLGIGVDQPSCIVFTK